MKLYSKRHGKRALLDKTYCINRDIYSILLDSCKRYQKNLTHIFTLDCYEDYTASNYVAFDAKGFITRIKLKIPSLFIDDFSSICLPVYDNEIDQYALLDLIEFFAQNIKDIIEYWNNDQYKNYKNIDCLDSSNIFKDFKEEINEIFIEAGLLYELTDEKIIERIVENNVLTKKIENSFSALSETGLRELLEDSVALYKTPHPTARKDAVEKIWGALERLKTYYSKLNKKQSCEKIVNDMANGNKSFAELFDVEFRTLSKIGNSYGIRHHETDQIVITDIRYYDYFFNRCLSLISFSIQYLE